MTVHEFMMMLIENIESVDTGDTKFVIRTPDGDYEPYTFTWDDTDLTTDEALVLDVLASG